MLNLVPVSIAQEPSASLGVRIAPGGLLSFKYPLNQEFALEGILSTRWNGVGLHALIQRYHPLEAHPNFHWYYGGGVHLGLHGRNNTINPAEGTNDKVFINLGVDLIGGIEYRLDTAPLVFSLDYMPSLYFTGNRWLVPEGIGLCVRYVL